jgi:hypothetical protein
MVDYLYENDWERFKSKKSDRILKLDKWLLLVILIVYN